MPYIKLTNVRILLDSMGIDPETNEGNNQLVEWVLERVPHCISIAFNPESDILEIFDPYVQPVRLLELGEVVSIDYSMG